MNAVPGVRGLFIVRAAALGFYLLSTLQWLILPRLGTSLELWFKVTAALWLLIDGAELAVAVPFSRGRQGTAAEATARALVMLLAVSLFASAVQALPQLGGPTLFHSQPATLSFYLATRLVFSAAEIVL